MATQEISPDEFARWANGAGGNLDRLDLTKAMKRCEALLVSETKQHFQTATAPDGTAWEPIKGFRTRGPGGGADQPLRDRGLLMASVTAGSAQGAVREITDHSLAFGTNLEYGPTHQYGVVIYPRNAKALAIPFTREAYRAGNPRRFGRELALVWPKGRAHGWLVEEKGTGSRARTVIHYLLVPRVRIPPRPFLGVNDRTADKMAMIVGDEVEDQLRR